MIHTPGHATIFDRDPSVDLHVRTGPRAIHTAVTSTVTKGGGEQDGRGEEEEEEQEEKLDEGSLFLAR